MKYRPVLRRTVLRTIIGAALRLTVIIIAAVAMPAQMRAQPSATAAAENYVRAELERGLSIVNDRSAPEAQRLASLRAYLRSFMDTRRLALFSLGPARRSATPQQIDQFVSVFQEYTIAYCESLLTNYYSGQAVRITGASQEGPNSYRVDLAFESPQASAQKGTSAIDIGVRVSSENGRFVITDIAALGIWLSVHERDEVAEYLLETHGNFGGLVSRYRTLVERKLRTLPDAAPQRI
jgi:ABC-type transporter MlaC component